MKEEEKKKVRRRREEEGKKQKELSVMTKNVEQKHIMRTKMNWIKCRLARTGVCLR